MRAGFLPMLVLAALGGGTTSGYPDPTPAAPPDLRQTHKANPWAVTPKAHRPGTRQKKRRARERRLGRRVRR